MKYTRSSAIEEIRNTHSATWVKCFKRITQKNNWKLYNTSSLTIMKVLHTVVIILYSKQITKTIIILTVETIILVLFLLQIMLLHLMNHKHAIVIVIGCLYESKYVLLWFFLKRCYYNFCNSTTLHKVTRAISISILHKHRIAEYSKHVT